VIYSDGVKITGDTSYLDDLTLCMWHSRIIRIWWTIAGILCRVQFQTFFH